MNDDVWRKLLDGLLAGMCGIAPTSALDALCNAVGANSAVFVHSPPNSAARSCPPVFLGSLLAVGSKQRAGTIRELMDINVRPKDNALYLIGRETPGQVRLTSAMMSSDQRKSWRVGKVMDNARMGDGAGSTLQSNGALAFFVQPDATVTSEMTSRVGELVVRLRDHGVMAAFARNIALYDDLLCSRGISSARVRQIILAVAITGSRPSAATLLGLSENTVRNRCKYAFESLGIGQQQDLARMLGEAHATAHAMREGLLRQGHEMFRARRWGRKLRADEEARIEAAMPSELVLWQRSILTSQTPEEMFQDADLPDDP